LASVTRAKQSNHRRGQNQHYNVNNNNNMQTSSDIIQRILETLSKMETSPSPYIKPTAVTYTCVITALSKSERKDAAVIAQQLLERMKRRYIFYDEEECQPDVVAYTAVMSCWGATTTMTTSNEKSDAAGAAERVLALLKEMKEQEPPITPNAMTYTAVLKAQAKSQQAGNSGVNPERVLQEMETQFQAGNKAVEPTTIHYNVVMDGYAKGPSAEKAQDVQRLYRGMLALRRENTRPNIITYNTMLRACANTFGDKQIKQIAMGIALNTFRLIVKSNKNNDESSVRPSSITFLFFLKATRKLIPKEIEPEKRSMILERTVSYCCELGLMNDYVLGQVKSICSIQELTDLFQRLAGNELHEFSQTMRASDLPPAWTRNA